jgi:hypothetical protein
VDASLLSNEFLLREQSTKADIASFGKLHEMRGSYISVLQLCIFFQLHNKTHFCFYVITALEPMIQSDPRSDSEHSAESQHHWFMDNAYEYRSEISPPNSSNFPSLGVRELKEISMALTAHRVQVAGTELDLNDSRTLRLSNGFQEVQKGWLMVSDGVAKSQSTIRILEEALSAKNAQLEELQREIH